MGTYNKLQHRAFYLKGEKGKAMTLPGVKSSLTLAGSPKPNGTLTMPRTLTKSLPGTPNFAPTLNLIGSRTLSPTLPSYDLTDVLLLTGGRTFTAGGPINLGANTLTIKPLVLSKTLAGLPQVTGSSLSRVVMGNLALRGISSTPGALVYRRCERHTAYLYDRGGRRQIASLSPLGLVRWERLRDDVSTAQVLIQSPDPACANMLELAEAGRMELVIFRGNQRVWEGPVMRLSYRGDQVEVEAHDVMRYLVRTGIENEYDSRYPNNELVLNRVRRIITAELARWEAVDPAANVMPHIQYIFASDTTRDAGTAAHTLPFEMTLFEHIDSYAARGGLDYTVVGRSIFFFDVHQKIGQTAMVTRDDFLGDPIITQYGMELATKVTMTDGKGNYGTFGGPDPYYGAWEVIHQAYDETAGPVESNAPPSVAEMRSQAQRAWTASHIPPLVVRVPDNSRINPDGVLDINNLVPGVHIPLNASLPGRAVTQMQKLDSMKVEETPDGGETIQVTLSPATAETVFVED